MAGLGRPNCSLAALPPTEKGRPNRWRRLTGRKDDAAQRQVSPSPYLPLPTLPLRLVGLDQMKGGNPLTTIVKLAFAQKFAPECASWIYQEWGHRNPASTLADVTTRFLARANLDEIPIAFVALWDGQPVGTASLIAKEDPSDVIGPWVASVFVPEKYRGMGIARQLIEVTEAEALQLGFSRVWLSAAAPTMYEKLGYQFTDERKHGEPVMVKHFPCLRLQG